MKGSAKTRIRTHALTCVATLVATLLPVEAQERGDLDRLFDATWAMATADLLGGVSATQTVRDVFPNAGTAEITRQTMGAWADVSFEIRVPLPGYGRLDSVTCKVLTEAGVARLEQVTQATGANVLDHATEPVREFIHADIKLEQVQAMRSCVGAFHITNEAVDFAAWIDWYSALQTTFENRQLSVTRSQATMKLPYAAGVLSARTEVCDSGRCVMMAAPFNTALPQHNTNQATISILSIDRR